MASTRVGHSAHGFALPDDRVSRATLSADHSSYTEAGPRPGSPVPGNPLSQLSPRISGGQDADLDLRATHAGMPLRDQGARLEYRSGSTAAADYVGWNPPNVWRDWIAADHSSSTYSHPDAIVVPSTQQVVVAAVRTDSGQRGTSWTFDPSTHTFGAGVTASDGEGLNATSGVAITLIPGTERLLMFVLAGGLASTGELHYSDDTGATWTLAADQGLLSVSPTGVAVVDRMRLFYDGGDLVLFVMTDLGGVKRLDQYVSDLGGTGFRHVDEWDAVGSVVDVARLATGRYLLIRIDSGDTKVRTISDGWAVFEAAADVTVDSTLTADQVAVHVDHDGTVYAWVRVNADVYLFRSIDSGATWDQHDFGPVASGDGSNHPDRLCPVALKGSCGLVHQWHTSGSNEGGVALAVLGGWDQLLAARDTAGSTDLDLGRDAFGPTSLAGVISGTWAPWQVGSGTSLWTTTTTGGTELAASGYSRILTGPGDTLYMSAALSTGSDCLLRFVVERNAGGILTATDIGIAVTVADGATFEYGVEVRISSTGFRVHDVQGAATIVDVVETMTTMVEIAVLVDAPNVEVFHRSPGDVLWSKDTSSDTLTNSGGGFAATGTVSWGCISAAAGATTSRWRTVAFAAGFSGKRWASHDSDIATRQFGIGKIVTSTPYPLAHFAASGLAAYVSAVDGPAIIAETWDVDAEHDHPVDSVFAAISPSRDATWRTTAHEVDADLVWSLDGTADASLGSTTLVLAVRNANVRTIELAGWNGATYDTLGTLDLATGFVSLACVVTGNVVRPNTAATTSAARYIHRGEYTRGGRGTIHFTGLGGEQYSRITRHTEGLWAQDDARHAEFTVVDAGSTGTCHLIHHAGVLVVHNVTSIYDRYRVRIPAQTTADGYYELGTVVLAAYVPTGRRWSHGYTRQHALNVHERITDRGTRYRTRRGDVLRTWTMGWPVPIDQQWLQGSTPTPDFYSAKAGYPGLVNKHDVPQLVAGLLADADSGAIPLVALASVPDASASDTHSITDPTLWLLGHMGSVTTAHPYGIEGQDEASRVELITISEMA